MSIERGQLLIGVLPEQEKVSEEGGLPNIFQIVVPSKAVESRPGGLSVYPRSLLARIKVRQVSSRIPVIWDFVFFRTIVILQ